MEDSLVAHGEVEGLSFELGTVGELEHNLGSRERRRCLYGRSERSGERCRAAGTGGQILRRNVNYVLTVEVLYGVVGGNFIGQRNDVDAGL